MICLNCYEKHLENIKTGEYTSVHCDDCAPHFDILLDVLGKNANNQKNLRYENEFETLKNLLSQKLLP